MATNFPQQGDDEAVSLRNSRWELWPDRDHLERLRTDYPTIWSRGGNVLGNKQYDRLNKVRDQGGDVETDTDEEAIRLREAWVARHRKNFRLAGVIALLKWHAVGSRGVRYMRRLVDAEIRKVDAKRKAEEPEPVYKTAAMVLLPDAALADKEAARAEAERILGPVDADGTGPPHLTLLYAGKLTLAQVQKAADALLAGLADDEPFAVRGAGLDVFPAGDHGAPLILAYNPSGPVAGVHARLREAFGDLTVADQWPDYRPHSTLGYLPEAPSAELLDELRAAEVGRARWTAAAVVLMVDDEVAEVVDLAAPVTDFPVPGGREPPVLPASRFEVFDPEYAEALEEAAPELWDGVGGVDADEAAVLLASVAARGGEPAGDDEVEAVRAREVWAAANVGRDGLEAVVEAVKWLVVLDIGEDEMKRTIEAAKQGATGDPEEAKMADGNGPAAGERDDGIVHRAFMGDTWLDPEPVAEGEPPGEKVRLIAATTADVDRYDDIVDQDTIKWDNWVAAGAPLLYVHDSGHGKHGGIVVGRAKPETIMVRLISGKKAFSFEPEWDDHPVNPMGQLVAHQWGTYLKAVSIGFRPGKGSVPRASLPKDHYAAYPEGVTGYGMFYTNCEILEVSPVPVPANPYATQVEMSAGGKRGGEAVLDVKSALLSALDDGAVLERLAKALGIGAAQATTVEPPPAAEPPPSRDWLDP